MLHAVHQLLPCPPGNKTPFLFCLSQLFRINRLLLVHTPPLSDTDVLDHPGLNTSILESSTSLTFIQITTIHVFLQSSTSSTLIQMSWGKMRVRMRICLELKSLHVQTCTDVIEHRHADHFQDHFVFLLFFSILSLW